MRWAAAFLLVSACHTPQPAVLPAPGTPLFSPGPFGASQVSVQTGGPLTVEDLADVEACARCHEEQVNQWHGSAHAHSSLDNPFYRGSFLRFKDSGRDPQFCAGCHDPLLLLSDRVSQTDSPDQPFASAGITCTVCHSITATSPEGNGSYQLTSATIPVPLPGDAESLRQHRMRLSPEPIRSSALCGTCHRSAAGAHTGHDGHFVGIDDIGAWTQSAYGGSHADRYDEEVQLAGCQSCHMPAAGQHRSHRFPGGHTALGRMLGDGAQLEAQRKLLVGAVTVEVAYLHTNPAEAGGLGEVGVVLRNERVGHRFPGGTRDIAEAWVEVVVTDANGNLVAAAGTDQGQRNDPSAYRLRSVLLDGQGQPVLNHDVDRFAAPAFDTTLAARDARLVRYRFTMPTAVSEPLRAQVRLRHRSRNREVHALACEASRATEGSLDGCAGQPITEIGSDEFTANGNDHRTSRGTANLALAMLHDVNERTPQLLSLVDDAIRREEDVALIAELTLIRAEAEARTGRPAAVLDTLSDAPDSLAQHPAAHRIVGAAQARVWKFAEAAEAFRAATEQAPRDSRLRALAARAYASADNPTEALRHAREGLRRGPHSPDLLRIAALALEELGAESASAARDHWLSRRAPEVRSALLTRCDQEVPGCFRDRQPVPVIEMRLPTSTSD